MRSVRTAKSLSDVSQVLGAATRDFDFDHFALVQQVQSRLPLGPVQLSDYPAAWIELLRTSSALSHDPVLIACQKLATPFAWNDLPAMLTLSKHQRAYMENARAAGLDAGYTIPIHVPGQASGLCSFVTTKGRELPTDSLPAAQYLAHFAFEAARRLVAETDELSGGVVATSPAPPRLTQRQLDCVVLAARGKSNWVSGQLLGLSPGTVHKYLESAKRRYGVSSRTELVVRALYDGQLSFRDVMDGRD